MSRRSLTKRALLAAMVAGSTLLAAGVAAAEKVKVAAIYTLPVEQQWISRIHLALNTAAERAISSMCFRKMLPTPTMSG